MNSEKFDIETELEEAIKPIGGVRPQAIIGRVSHKTADFVFPSLEVVAELKSLDEDHIASEQTIEKASTIYEAELRSGRAPTIAFGTNSLTTAGFSEEYTRKIADLYRVPIARLLRKVNKQNLATIQALGYSRPLGVVMLANNNETALDPDHLRFILNHELRHGTYPGIDVAIAFSGSLVAVVPGSNQPLDYWIKLSKHGGDSGREAFFDGLRVAWFTHLSRLRGIEWREFPTDPQTLAALQSTRRSD